MLKKRKEMENGNSPGSSTSFSERSLAPGSGLGSSEEKTVIGEQISIEGSICGKENLLIEGSMKGKIELEEHQAGQQQGRPAGCPERIVRRIERPKAQLASVH